MEGHRLRVGALAWSSSLLSSGSRDKSILQRDIRAQEDFVSKLSGHKSEVGLSHNFLPDCFTLGNDFAGTFDFLLATVFLFLHALSSVSWNFLPSLL